MIPLAAVVVLLLTACGGAKLSTAREQRDRGEYYDASRTYRKVYNKLTKREERPQRGVVAFEMAECYRQLNMAARASAAYQNALRYGYPDSMAQLRLAQSLHAEGKYPAALAAYEAFLDVAPTHPEALSGHEGARQAAVRKEQRTRYVVRQDRLANSRRADFAPQLTPTADILYFTTTNEKVTGDNRSEITGMKKSDVWMMKKNERGEWQRPEPVEGELNGELDEGIVSFSPDGSTMYLTRARREPNANTGVEIYTSQRSEATWSAPVKLEITADTISSYGHPAVSPDGTWLYFASDMPGEGGKDLWRINLKERQGSLENLGPDINTAGDEVFPYVYSDSLLYFSSDGHPGQGALDIFAARLQPGGGWKVENMGVPLNSEGDDFGITFDRTADHPVGFFSTNRNDGRGYDHIWTFELPDLVINISGWVLDHDEEPVPQAVIRIVGDDGTNRKTVARDDGSFTFPIDRGVTYVMLAGARGYLNARQQFTPDTAEEDAEYGIDFILASLNKPNIIENIFYDFDRATLRPESQEALDELVQMMNDNPNITIELAAHTDRKGSDEYNLDLSQRRAQAVIDYLTEHGIAADRMQAIGYGKSRPKTVSKRIATLYPQFAEGQLLDETFISGLSPEDQEAADQANRRTEFSVLSVDYGMY